MGARIPYLEGTLQGNMYLTPLGQWSRPFSLLSDATKSRHRGVTPRRTAMRTVATITVALAVVVAVVVDIRASRAEVVQV